MPVDSRAPRGPVSEAPPRRSSTQRSVMMSEAPPTVVGPPPPNRSVTNLPAQPLPVHPLPAPSLPPPSRASEPAPISFAAQTDVGKTRQHNEDNFLVDRKLRLYVVCDGMGGHAAGEVASAVAV